MGVKEVTSGQTQTEPQSLPTGWARATIGDILTLEYGKSLVKADRAESGEYPVYGSSGIVGFHTEHLIKQPAIIVGRKGAAGAVHLCKKDFWPIDTTYFVKVNNSLSTDFIYYLLKFCRLQKYESSTAIPGLNRDHAYGEKISLPPLAEQQRIVAKIEELFSELDKGVENLRTAQQQLKAYRQALINDVLKAKNHSDSLTVSLSDLIGKINQGWSPKCELNRQAVDGEWAIIKTTAVQPMQYSQEECKPLPKNLEPRPEIEIKAGDFLMTRKGPRNRTGVVCLVEATRSKSMLCDTVYRFRCDETRVYPKYLELVLNSPAVVAELDRRKSGISDSGISLNHSKLKNLPVPLAGTIAAQKNIVDEIDLKLGKITSLEVEISQSLLKAEALRQSILKKAFSGQLVAQDANDEPASVLLERIKAEKQAKPAAGTRKARTAAAAPPNNVVPMPVRIPGIASTDLHAGILALAYSAHEAEPKYLPHFGHVKGEKVSHLVEAHLGIELDRAPVKDAAGPNDYPHLKKVESRARKVGWFDLHREPGATAYSLHKLAGFNELQAKTRQALGPRLGEVEALLRLLLPLNTRQAEIVATLYAAWNNLLLAGHQPSDQQIIFEARDNWHPDKLKIEQERFEKGLSWMKTKGLVPNGQGRPVKSKSA